MAFNQNIPLATDKISQSQGQILGNFQSLYTWANANHVSFDLTNAGKHIYVQMPVQGAPPAFTLGEIDLWNQAYATTGKNELFVQKENQAADVSIPMTASILGANPAPGATGWTFLPSGILLKWGQATTVVGTVVVNLNAGGDLGSNFTALYSCQVSYAVIPAPGGTLSCIRGFPNLSINSNTAGSVVNWFAIGTGA
jgi:hypothetical protein